MILGRNVVLSWRWGIDELLSLLYIIRVGRRANEIEKKLRVGLQTIRAPLRSETYQGPPVTAVEGHYPRLFLGSAACQGGIGRPGAQVPARVSS